MFVSKSCFIFRADFKRPKSQTWTNTRVPDTLKTVHDFGDEQGSVPAIPTDNPSVDDNLIFFRDRVAGITFSDNSSVDDTLLSLKDRVAGATVNDNASIDDNLVSFKDRVAGITFSDSSSVNDTLLSFEVIQNG